MALAETRVAGSAVHSAFLSPTPPHSIEQKKRRTLLRT